MLTIVIKETIIYERMMQMDYYSANQTKQYNKVNRNNIYFENMKWTKDQCERFEKFILGDDMDFYEEYTIHLTDEEQVKFFAENPDFMSGYPIDRNRIKLLRDPIYRRLMRKIKRYEESKK